jgi:hypothetical protein
MTPPQAIPLYLVCVCLVAGLSFYVGTPKPKKAIKIIAVASGMPVMHP